MAKDAGAKKAGAKAPAAKRTPKADAAEKPAKAAAARAPTKKAAAKPAATRPPVERTRVVIPMAVYEPNKAEIKAPFKEHGLKWTFLGEGKGLYKREGLHVFAQFQDGGVDYAIWGEDKEAQAAILAAWERLLGASFVQDAKAAGVEAQKADAKQEESEAMRLWRLQEPRPRPGEPEFFFKKRVAEWESKRPA